jgi:hypothetical protein
MGTGRTTFSKLTRKTYRFGRGLSQGAIMLIMNDVLKAVDEVGREELLLADAA